MQYAVDWLHRRARLSPNKLAVIDTINNQEITYAEWNRQANMAANFLRDHFRVQEGDIVAILSENTIEYLYMLFACNKLGATLQCLNFRLASKEITKLIEYTEPRVLLYEGGLKHVVRAVREEGLPFPNYYVSMGDKDYPTDIDFSDRSQCSDKFDSMPTLPLDHPWVICYTGGTTGLPKGVLMTYQTMIANATNTIASWNLDQDDMTTLSAPLCHTGGLNVFTTPLVYLGGTSILTRGFDVEQIYDLFERYPITVFFAVPTVYIMMQRSAKWEHLDCSRFKWFISGGAPCPEQVYEKFMEKNANFCIGYGLTEAGPNTFAMPREKLPEKRGYVGYPMFCVELKILNADGNVVREPNCMGELFVRGQHLTPGYYRNVSATTKAIDADGWLHTGDLAEFDEEGAYRIVGRGSDMFISGGENVYPAEIESVLCRHPEVLEACVFGKPHPKWGEIGCAIIAVAQGTSLTEHDIKEFLFHHIARYKVPRVYVFKNELPKTLAGKLDRKSMIDEIEPVLEE